MLFNDFLFPKIGVFDFSISINAFWLFSISCSSSLSSINYLFVFERFFGIETSFSLVGALSLNKEIRNKIPSMIKRVMNLFFPGLFD